MEKQQRFLYPSSFRELTIDSPTLFQLEKGTDVHVRYDSRSNILRCRGLLLSGLTFSSDSHIQSKLPPLQWRKKSFVPFNNEKLVLGEFLSASLQLVAEEGLNSWRNKDKATEVSVVEIKSNNGTHSLLSKPLREVTNSLTNINAKIKEIELSQAKGQLVFKPGESYLVIGDYTALEKLAEIVACNVFLLAYVHGHQAPTNGAGMLRPVLVHNVKAGSQLMLLRKMSEVKLLRVLEIDDNEHWLTDITHLFNGGDNGHPVAVVSRIWTFHDILPTLAQQKYAHRLRCVFLDKSAPTFSLNNPLYQSQLGLGLSVSILSQGVWGTFYNLTVDIQPDNIQSLISSSDMSLDVNVVALNTTTVTYHPETIPDQVEVQFIDYCGTRQGRERVMGVAHFNPLTNTLTPDRTLSWPVPAHWSMEDAATVPTAFSLAYYCLHVRTKLKKEENVLIHVGSCPVSQACVAVALQLGAQVFVTLQSSDQHSAFLQIFPQMKPEQLLPLEHFDIHLKQKTQGKGVHVLINCLQGSELTKSTYCRDANSRFIHFCSVDLRDRESIGLSMFLQTSEFFGVSLSNIFNTNTEIKTRLQTYITEGLEKGVVRPLRKRVFELQDFTEAMKNLRSRSCEEKTLVVVNSEGHSSLSGYFCEPNMAYLIIGSGDGLWLNIAEWLVQHGARKLVIALGKENLTTNSSCRYNQLTALHYVRIILTSAAELDSHSGAVDLLSQAQKLGDVSAVFCVALEEKSMKVANLDSALRLMVPQLKHFVCVLGGSISVCESRAQLGLPSILIQSDSPLHKPEAVLPYLSSLLCDNTPGSTFLINDLMLSANHDNTSLTDQDVCSLLPSSVEELVEVAHDMSVQPSLREVKTLSPNHETVRHNLLPVFVLPGTHAVRLQPFLQRLIHPAYCTTLTGCSHSVESTAQLLLQEILQIQSQGPYNLVGETWSGAVALQLATLLELRGHTVELFLLDAAPATAQLSVRAMCDKMNHSLDTSLLATTLNLQPQAVKQLTELNSWEEQQERALEVVQSEAQVEAKHVQSVGKALTALRSHLMALLAHKPQKQLFKGSVHLVRPRGASEDDICRLHLYCQQRPFIYITDDENQEEMIKNPACATIVNRNILYTWDL